MSNEFMCGGVPDEDDLAVVQRFRDILEMTDARAQRLAFIEWDDERMENNGN